jgi:hypothetical protein
MLSNLALSFAEYRPFWAFYKIMQCIFLLRIIMDKRKSVDVSMLPV